MKHKHHRGENTVFQIDKDNQGVFDAAAFREKHQEKTPKRKTPSKRRIGSEPFEKDSVGLRVIGGKFHGSKLQYIGDNRVRPMKDRTREAVFNLLGPVAQGKYAIDLFSGTGALLIEAVSRGAVGGTAIEIHLPTARKLQENLQSLNLTPNCELKKTDVFFWAKTLTETEYVGPRLPWLVFCSPPYDFWVSREKEMLELLAQVFHRAEPDSFFVVESDERFDTAKLETALPVDSDAMRIRSYLPAKIVIFQKSVQEG